MKLSRKDYQALELAANLADEQRLLKEPDFPIERAVPLVGALLGLLLLFGIGISLVSSERDQTEQIAFSESSGFRSPNIR